MITIRNNTENGCELVGTFSLLTQAALGVLCLSSLIVKRYYEVNRRNWKVWVFDVSKQLFGALGVHVFNVILSIIKSKADLLVMFKNNDDDPCNWYFLTIMFDCTIGVYIFWLMFRLVNYICVKYFQVTEITSGEYGDVDRPSVVAYLKQLGIYFVSLMITKVILYFCINVFAAQLLWVTEHILLGWLDDYPGEFEIVVVMFIVPIIMNVLQLVLVDNIIKNRWKVIELDITHNT